MEVTFSAAAQRALDETWSKLIASGKRDGWRDFLAGKMHQALAETWSKLVHDGKSDAWLVLYDGTMPKSPDDPVTQRLLARLHIEPRTMEGETANVIESGIVNWARMIGANGRAVADFTASTKDGTGFLSFNTVDLRKGGPARVSSMAILGDLAPHGDGDDRREFGSDL